MDQSFICHPHAYPCTNRMSYPAFDAQPQCVTELWPVLVSRPTEGRRLRWPGGWLHTETVWPPEDGQPS